MRIGLVVPGFSASEDDWCIPALLDLVRVLARNHRVCLVALRYPHRKGQYCVHGAQILACGGARAAGVARLRLLAGAVADVASLARRERLDVLHGLWADEPGTVAVVAARLTGRPVAVSLMGGELVRLDDIDYGVQRRLSGRLLVRAAIGGASLVTAGSTAMVRLAADRGFDRTVHRLPLGVDTARFHPMGRTETLRGSPRLLHVGSLAPVKGHALLLDAFARVVASHPDAHLHLVGRGPLAASLRDRLTAGGLDASVTFHGEVEHDRLPAYYRGSDLVVVSSRFESQSMVALEAVACGVPVVGTAVGALPDLAPAVRTVPPGDAPALADAIAGWTSEGRALTALRGAGLDLIARQYGLETAAARFVQCYRDMISGPPTRRQKPLVSGR